MTSKPVNLTQFRREKSGCDLLIRRVGADRGLQRQDGASEPPASATDEARFRYQSVDLRRTTSDALNLRASSCVEDAVTIDAQSVDRVTEVVRVDAPAATGHTQSVSELVEIEYRYPAGVVHVRDLLALMALVARNL